VAGGPRLRDCIQTLGTRGGVLCPNNRQVPEGSSVFTLLSRGMIKKAELSDLPKGFSGGGAAIPWLELQEGKRTSRLNDG